MLREGVEPRRQHDSIQSRACEDMTAPIGISLEPVRIVKGASTQAENVGKAFQIQVDRGATSAAEINRYTFAACIRLMIIVPQDMTRECDVLSPEYRFDQKGRTRNLLAKRTMTDRDAHRLRNRSIADISTQAAALMNLGHCGIASATRLSHLSRGAAERRLLQSAIKPIAETMYLLSPLAAFRHHQKIAHVQR